MSAKPKLMDVKLSPVRFQPGDRVIVRVHHRISQEEARKIQKTVEKWAGDHVEVLVVDLTAMEVTIERRQPTLWCPEAPSE